MKKLITLLLVILLVMIAAGCSGDSGPMEVQVTSEQFAGNDNLSGSIDVPAGQSLIVKLDSNATTGYSWNEQADMSDGSVMKQTGHQYVTPEQSGDTPMVGAGGCEEWTFDAVKKGETVLTFRYARPWETDGDPARTYTLAVTVK